jgi:hypothetical protein
MLSAALRGNPYGTRHTASVCSGLGRLLHSRTARNAHRPNARAPLSMRILSLAKIKNAYNVRRFWRVLSRLGRSDASECSRSDGFGWQPGCENDFETSLSPLLKIHSRKEKALSGSQIVAIMQTAKPTKGYDLGVMGRPRRGAVVRRVLF